MRIRIVSLPAAREVEGFSLARFDVGELYDVDARLGQLLIVMGFAMLEMRAAQRGDDQPDRITNR